MLKSIILPQKRLTTLLMSGCRLLQWACYPKKKSEKERIVWGDDKKKGNLLTSMFDSFRWSDWFSLLFRVFWKFSIRIETTALWVSNVVIIFIIAFFLSHMKCLYIFQKSYLLKYLLYLHIFSKHPSCSLRLLDE